tara:strand:- start:12 stop:206 length:195 start_codon:yes stop_codon:yes gene_type:complete
MKHQLTQEQIQHLRETSVINASEIAYIMGDLLVIENVQNGTRRTQTHAIVERVLGEHRRRVLKG